MIIPRLEGKSDILDALAQEERAHSRIRHEYATGIFTAYIQSRLIKGHSKSAVSRKVQDLEHDLLHLYNSFAEARRATGLGPSPLFPAPSDAAAHSTSPASIPARRPSGAVSIAGIRTSVTNRAHLTSVFPHIPISSGPMETPPPPYSRTDPQPEITARLTRQLVRSGTSEAPPPFTSTRTETQSDTAADP
ncbi:hypothetical protein NCC49_006345 [Naganishia albida]|nr:hypothetical protein NCC49_006345 [Naganishia albida]